MSHIEPFIDDDKFEKVDKQKGSKAKWVIPLFLGAIGFGTYQYLNQQEDTAIEPEIIYEDKSEETAIKLNEEFSFLANEEAGRVPSIDMISRGVNVFNGDNWDTRPKGSAWLFTYTQAKTFSEPYNWKVPDQIVGTPVVDLRCASENGATEVYTSRSSEMLRETSSDSQTGFKQEIEVTAGVEIGSDETGKASGEAKTTLRTSLEWGSSNIERQSRREYQAGYKYSMSNQANSKIFRLEMDGESATTTEFKTAYSKMKDNETAHNFVKKYGTHWIEKANFGAHYSKTIYMSVDDNLQTASSFKNQASSFGFELWGFGHSSSSTEQNMKDTQNSSKVKNMKVHTENRGSIDFSSLPACSGMGSLNAPVMVDQKIQPYYKLPDTKAYPDATQAFQNFNKEVMNAANRCRNAKCQSKGDCMPNRDAWGTYTDFQSFDNYFIQDSNRCLFKSLFEENRKRQLEEKEAEERRRAEELDRQEWCVWIWNGKNYDGIRKYFCLDPSWNTNEFLAPAFGTIGFNDQAKSIKVGKYVIANVYRDSYNGPGYRWGIRGPVQTNDYFSDDVITALKVVKKSAAACLYEHSNQGGYHECFAYHNESGRNWYNMHPIGWGDIMSSLYVPEGVCVHVWADHFKRGEMETYGPGSYNAYHNDWGSSFEIVRGNC